MLTRSQAPWQNALSHAHALRVDLLTLDIQLIDTESTPLTPGRIPLLADVLDAVHTILETS